LMDHNQKNYSALHCFAEDEFLVNFILRVVRASLK